MELTGRIVSSDLDMSLGLLNNSSKNSCSGVSKVIATAIDGTTVIADTQEDCSFALPLIVEDYYVISFTNPSGNFIATLFSSYGIIFGIPADNEPIALGIITISNRRATFSGNYLHYKDNIFYQVAMGSGSGI